MKLKNFITQFRDIFRITETKQHLIRTRKNLYNTIDRLSLENAKVLIKGKVLTVPTLEDHRRLQSEMEKPENMPLPNPTIRFTDYVIKWTEATRTDPGLIKLLIRLGYYR